MQPLNGNEGLVDKCSSHSCKNAVSSLKPCSLLSHNDSGRPQHFSYAWWCPSVSCIPRTTLWKYQDVGLYISVLLSDRHKLVLCRSSRTLYQIRWPKICWRDCNQGNTRSLGYSCKCCEEKEFLLLTLKHDVITSTSSLLRRSRQTQHVQQLHSYIRHRHLRPLLSSAKQSIRSVTSVLHRFQWWLTMIIVISNHEFMHNGTLF